MDSNVTPQTWNLKPPKQPEHLKAKKRQKWKPNPQRKIKKKNAVLHSGRECLI